MIEDWMRAIYLFVIGLPLGIATWVTKKIVDNDKRITLLEALLVKIDREFEIRDKQRIEDREVMKEMRQDLRSIKEKL